VRHNDTHTGERRHDPVQQVNERHAQQLVDIARAFAGYPDAVSAHATSVDDAGVSLVIERADRTKVTTHVPFGASASGARRRLAFQALAADAADVLRNAPADGTSS
jgi:Domain of unknown function (DUF2470)